MGYKVRYGSLLVECETVDEVDALAKRMGGSVSAARHSAASEPSSSESRWTEKRVRDFLELIKSKNNQKKLIDALLANTEGKTEDQLFRLLSLDGGNALGGVTAGATKNARKVGADPDDLFVKRRVLIDGKKLREYFLTDSFRKAASQAGIK